MQLIGAVDQATSPESLAMFLSEEAQPYFAAEIIDRFAVEGDEKSGDWAPLSEATESIRASLGFPASDPINERTGDLLRLVAENYEIEPGLTGAVLQIPGESAMNQCDLRDKLTTAQLGSASNPIPNFGPTPPRPVLAVDPSDLEALLLLLRAHITRIVAAGVTL
jgi:hypothetical protein